MSTVVIALKGLPTTYNKDMAEDKDALFACIHTVQDVIRILEGVVSTLTVSTAET
jgi:argininosuccinate lyase